MSVREQAVKSMNERRFEKLNEEKKLELVDLYKAFGDQTRLRILSYLLGAGSVCVSDVASALGMTLSAVSHQLRILKQTRLISARREGKNIYYSIADDHVKSILNIALEHVLED